MVPRGRIELPTPAFSGQRSTTELPRHKGEKRIIPRSSADVDGLSDELHRRGQIVDELGQRTENEILGLFEG